MSDLDGLADYGIPITASLLARFWPKVRKTDACWLWTAAKKNTGYGRFSVRISHTLICDLSPHRLSYQIHFGPIPPGICVCHHCDVPLCVNPHHLFLGTHGDNARDREAKRRGTPHGLQGESHPMARLTQEDVVEIRNLSANGMSQTAIAELYPVTASSVWLIVHRKQWRHVE